MIAVENRIKDLFERKRGILSMYTTAGYPELHATLQVCRGFVDGGADIIELGMPFSDPVADGPTIQAANTKAIENGITVEEILRTVEEFRISSNTPVVLMGHLNTVIQFGAARFCERCSEAGVDGVILPDLPLEEYNESYRALFEKHKLSFIFLVTSETEERRIRQFDEVGSGFLYVVSAPSVTGTSLSFDESRHSYFSRLRAMNLKNPLVIGFGIDSRQRFQEVLEYADGAVIASAFLRELNHGSNYYETAKSFVESICGDQG